MINGESIFNQFVGKYQLSKTLRFELKPVGETEQFLKENKVFEKDKTIDDSYSQAKFYFDKLHQRFIDTALAPDEVAELDFRAFAQFLQGIKKKLNEKRIVLRLAREKREATDSIQKEINSLGKKVQDTKEDFYKQIVNLFNRQAGEWKKYYFGKKLEDGSAINFGKRNNNNEERENEKGVGFLTSAGVLQILKYEFPASKDVEYKKLGWPSLFVEESENPNKRRYIFDSFDRFSGYLTKFQATRKNVYADNGMATALATRIVSNFDLFSANARIFDEKYKDNFQEIGLEQADIFKVENYSKYLLQKNIEALEGAEDSDNSYNKVIGRINKVIKEYGDKKISEAKTAKGDFKKSNFPTFRTLEKQILGEIEQQAQLIEATEEKTEEEIFIERFKEFIAANEVRFDAAKKFMQVFLIDKEFASEYERIYVRNSTINTISRRWFASGYDFERNLPQVSSNKKENDVIKVKKFVTISDIKEAIERLEDRPFREDFYRKGVIRQDHQPWKQFLSMWKYEFEGLFTDTTREDGIIIYGYDSRLKEACTLKHFSKARKKDEIAKVKNYADAALRIYQMMKYLALDELDMAKLTDISTEFYAQLEPYAKDFQLIKYYNAFRNYITKKPFDENKIKLNFEKDTLLQGFSKQYNSYLFKSMINGRDKFYLGVLKKGERELDEKVGIKKMSDYLYFPASQLKFQNIINKAFKPIFGYQYTEQKDESRAIMDAQQFIRERHLKKHPGLQSLVDGKFQSKKEFTKAVNDVCIEIYSENAFIPMDKSQVEDKLKSGSLYLFLLKNKDWEEFKKPASKKIFTRFILNNFFLNKI